MNSEAKKYLETEIEISKFRIASLEKLLTKGERSAKRLISIEEDFQKIDFNSFVSDLPDLLCAINIFRNSREAFKQIYNNDISTSFKEQISNLEVLNLIKNLLNAKLKEFVDNKWSIAGAKKRRLLTKVIVLLLSATCYIDDMISVASQQPRCESCSNYLQNINNNFKFKIFKYYNYVIDNSSLFGQLSELQKSNLSKTKKLSEMKIQDDKLGFFSLSWPLIRRRKVQGFFLPLPHCGREIATPYYMELFSCDGLDITSLFEERAVSAINEIDEGTYYKFIPIRNSSLNCIEKIVGINNDCKHFLNKNLSKIFIATSRTEDEGIRDAMILASAILQEIITSSKEIMHQ